jgi:hypothetical protein
MPAPKGANREISVNGRRPNGGTQNGCTQGVVVAAASLTGAETGSRAMNEAGGLLI